MSAILTVVGLGSGDPDQLTIGILNKMRGASALYLRTKEHPAVKVLDEFGVAFESFDTVYETKESFPEVYEEITIQLIAAVPLKLPTEAKSSMRFRVTRW